MKKLLALVLLASMLWSHAAPPALAEDEAESESLLDRVFRLIEDAGDLVQMDGDDLYDLIGIDPEECESFVWLADNNALSGRELIVIIALDEDGADSAADMLQRYLDARLRETRNYLPDAYEALSQAQVIRLDLTLVLSVAAPAGDEAALLLSEE